MSLMVCACHLAALRLPAFRCERACDAQARIGAGRDPTANLALALPMV